MPDRARRIAEVTALVALWMAIGFVFRQDGSTYLLVGIPLVVAFQLVIRRRPLWDVWVRGAPKPTVTARTVIVVAVFAALAYPAYLWLSRSIDNPLLIALWMSAYAIGAVGAAYAVQNLGWDRRAVIFALAAAGIGIVWQVATSAIFSQPVRPLDTLTAGLESASLNLAVGFVVEEVAFRGLIDSHVHRMGESRGWLTALFVSALWGLWHLPIVIGLAPLPLVLLSLFIPHIAIGIPLSFAWRRSGNLALPAAAHGTIDAVRDGLAAGLA